MDEDPDWVTRLDTKQEDPSDRGAAGVNIVAAEEKCHRHLIDSSLLLEFPPEKLARQRKLVYVINRSIFRDSNQLLRSKPVVVLHL